MSLSSYDLAGEDPAPMTKAEVTALKSLVRKLPPNPVIIQIGAERGCSTLAMLEERLDSFIFSIDIGDAHSEIEHLCEAGLPRNRVVRGLGFSQEIGMFWPELWMCDMLFVDGDHCRPGIDVDIEYWVNKVFNRGIVAFHDYIPNPPEHIIGRVADAVDEWIQKTRQKVAENRTINHLDQPGWFPMILREDRLIAFRAY